ncbi:MAG: AB hydrolase superfamily protein YdjP [Candidatus Thorarchaeota archaeon]|nr:MAG: AB hydrolase superfamily protein YdjP [Candidatus Thorarchaeota archaeon]
MKNLSTDRQNISICGFSYSLPGVLMPYFEYNGLKLHYLDVDEREDKYNGIPMVLVHGAGSYHVIWTLQIEEFAKSHRVIALDLSNHGLSDDNDDPADIHDYAKEVAALVRHVGLDKYVLVGHSMGGGVVMSYGLQQDLPQPTAMVLVSTRPDLKIRNLAVGLVIEAVEDTFNLLRGRISKHKTREYEIRSLEGEMKEKRPKMMSRDLKACDIFDVTEQLSEIQVPILVVCGDEDNIMPLDEVEEYEVLFPDAEIMVVNKSDHNPMVEQPEQFNQILADFLKLVESEI